MGKRRRYRFPHGINGVDRFFYPNRLTHPQAARNDIIGTGYYDNSEGFIPRSDMYSPTDPFGMYTGVPKDILEQPQQDADDL